jgi:hypothetical protein
MGHTPFTERGSYSGLVLLLTERIKIGSGSHRNTIFENFVDAHHCMGISESYVARSHHMLSLTCFPNQAEWPVHTAPAVTKENSVRDRTHRVTESFKDEKKITTAFDCCKQIRSTYFLAVPPGDK